jgi:hypothetical protein
MEAAITSCSDPDVMKHVGNWPSSLSPCDPRQMTVEISPAARYDHVQHDFSPEQGSHNDH